MAILCWRCALPCLHDATQPTRRGIRTQHTRRDAAYTARKPNAAYTARRSLHGAKKTCILDTTQPTRRGKVLSTRRDASYTARKQNAACPARKNVVKTTRRSRTLHSLALRCLILHFLHLYFYFVMPAVGLFIFFVLLSSGFLYFLLLCFDVACGALRCVPCLAYLERHKTEKQKLRERMRE